MMRVFSRLLILFGLSFIFSSFLLANENAIAKANKLHIEGRVLIDQAKYDEALENFEESLEIRLKFLDKNDLNISHSYNNIGVILGEKGQYDKAIEYHNKALEIRLQSSNKDLYYLVMSYDNIGSIYSTTREYDKAIEAYNEAIELEPKNGGVHNKLGAIYQWMGENNKAIYFFKKAIALNDKDSLAYNNIALVYFYEKEYDKIIKFSKKAIMLNSKDNIAHSNLGNAYLKKGKYDKAIKFFEKAIDLNPKSTVDYINMGVAYERQTKYDRAIEFFKKAIKLDSNNSLAYFNIGNQYRNKQDYDKSIEFYEKAIDLNPKYIGAYQNKALSYRNQKKYDKAISALEKAIKLDPSNSMSYLNLGVIYSDKKNTEKAIEFYEKAKKHDPNNILVDMNIGVIYEDEKEYDKALKFYQKALDIRITTLGKNHDKTADNYEDMGLIWANKKEYDKALESYQKALDIRMIIQGKEHKKTANIYFKMGLVWSDKGKYNKALKAYEKSLNIRKVILGENHVETAKSYNKLGLIWYIKGEYDRAFEFYQKALKTQMNTEEKNNEVMANSYNNIGLIWSIRGEHNKALKYQEKALEAKKIALGEKHEKVVNSHLNVGIVLSDKGEYNKALESYNQALNIIRIISGENHELTARCYRAIGYIWIYKEDYDKALNFFHKALDILVFTLGTKDERVAEIYYDIGLIYRMKSKPDEAIKFHDQSLDILYTLAAQGYDVSGMIGKNIGSKIGIKYLIHILLGLVLFIVLIIWSYKKYWNNTIRKLSKEPHKFFTFTYSEVLKVQKKLGQKKWKNLLKELEFEESQFDNVLEFYRKPNIKIFTEQLKVLNFEKQGEYYWLSFLNMGLSVNNFFLYLCDEKVQRIKDKCLTGDKIFVISNELYQDEIAELAHKKTNNIIAPTREELMKLLLSNKPNILLFQIFVNCLSTKHLSPYTTAGGVVEESQFFGRTEIIKNITNNQYRNYLLVGARQLGKSSILKAIERHYKSSSNVKCYYLSLEHDNIIRALSKVLGLAKDTSLEVLEEEIKTREKRLIFLIDESDYFVEMQNSTLISGTFRKLSQEGKATFILTGFWKLYESVNMDYHSPLKNFGEIIYLGKLETEACKELMIEPMKRIGVEYENMEIVERLIERCGHRPNLIAIVCDTLLRDLEANVIGQEDIERGLDSDEIMTKVNEWESLGTTDSENRLNRLIVYLTYEKETFTLNDIVKEIENRELEIKLEDIKTSLKQLVLAYILEKEKGTYSYRIPLLKEMLEEEEDTIEIEVSEIVRVYKKV